MEEKYQEEFTNQNEKTEGKAKKKKGFYLKVIALALCCSILGGVVGAGSVILGGGFMAEFAVKDRIVSSIMDGDSFIFRNRFGIGPFGRGHMSIDFDRNNLADGPYIGVVVSNSIEDAETPSGALIKTVEKGSPADKAGLIADDIITMVNNKKIKSSDGLADIVDSSEPGDILTLTVYRQNETFETNVTVGEQSIISR